MCLVSGKKDRVCSGGEEERLAELQGLPPPDSGYRPAMRNVAPREEEWKPSKSNTQTLPVKGQVHASKTPCVKYLRLQTAFVSSSMGSRRYRDSNRSNHIKDASLRADSLTLRRKAVCYSQAKEMES